MKSVGKMRMETARKIIFIYLVLVALLFAVVWPKSGNAVTANLETKEQRVAEHTYLLADFDKPENVAEEVSPQIDYAGSVKITEASEQLTKFRGSALADTPTQTIYNVRNFHSQEKEGASGGSAMWISLHGWMNQKSQVIKFEQPLKAENIGEISIRFLYEKVDTITAEQIAFDIYSADASGEDAEAVKLAWLLGGLNDIGQFNEIPANQWIEIKLSGEWLKKLVNKNGEITGLQLAGWLGIGNQETANKLWIDTITYTVGQGYQVADFDKHNGGPQIVGASIGQRSTTLTQFNGEGPGGENNIAGSFPSYSDRDVYCNYIGGATAGSALWYPLYPVMAMKYPVINFTESLDINEISSLTFRCYFQSGYTSTGLSREFRLFSTDATGAKEEGYLIKDSEIPEKDIPKNQWFNITLEDDELEQIADSDGKIRGFTFAGWCAYPLAPGEAAEDGKDAFYIDTISYAKNGNKVNYLNLKGGTNNPENIDRFYSGEPNFELFVPTREGAEFIKWTDEQGEVITEIDTSLDRDLNLYAQWNLINYKISFVAGEGAEHGNTVSTYNIETEIALEPAVKEGFLFVGWYDEDGNKVELLTGRMGDLVLTARFSAIRYEIEYVLNGGTNADGNYWNYTIDETFILEAPTKEGYTFEGWYDNPAFTGEKITSIEKGTTGNKKFYAKFVEKTPEPTDPEPTDPEPTDPEPTDPKPESSGCNSCTAGAGTGAMILIVFGAMEIIFKRKSI